MDVSLRKVEEITALWALRFYHQLHDFLHFLETEHLLSAVRSIVVLTDQMMKTKFGRFPHESGAHESGAREWRYVGAALFWSHLFCNIDPRRIVIVAPPLDMACLANAAIDTFGVS
jgi:hypothetical protein